jgi:hypothetical protein
VCRLTPECPLRVCLGKGQGCWAQRSHLYISHVLSENLVKVGRNWPWNFPWGVHFGEVKFGQGQGHWGQSSTFLKKCPDLHQTFYAHMVVHVCTWIPELRGQIWHNIVITRKLSPNSLQNQVPTFLIQIALFVFVPTGTKFIVHFQFKLTSIHHITHDWCIHKNQIMSLLKGRNSVFH